MKIAILGWGSLIWDSRKLKYDKQIGWLTDGPKLPIDFSRISNDGRLTLVIDENAESVKTLYAFSEYRTLDKANLNLAVREGTGIKSIGCYNKIKVSFVPSDFRFSENIQNWADTMDIDAVIWTNLSPNFALKTEKDLTIDNIVSYYNDLNGHQKTLFEEYIRKAPDQIDTQIRKQIMTNYDWSSMA